jgi:pimeloyl-ACP methyl ester carboxylesterase
LGVAQFHVAGYSLGARVALELATRGRTLSVIAISPDGLGTPLERVHRAAALMTGRTLARLLAPIATPVAATGAGRSLFFAMERSRPWMLPADDAGRLLLDFAEAPGYLDTVQAAMFDVPTRLERITWPVFLLQGTADPLVSMQSPRFLAFVRHAQMRWLPGLSHVPISDNPRLVASLMLRFLKTATEKRTRPNASSISRLIACTDDAADGPRTDGGITPSTPDQSGQAPRHLHPNPFGTAAPMLSRSPPGLGVSGPGGVRGRPG